jgi:anti-anti-sigma factor
MLDVNTEKSIEELEDAVILRCAGSLAGGNEAALLCAALGRDARNITLDLSHVDAIDAAGIGALISLQAAGIYLRLMNPVKAVREALRVTKLDSVFEIFDALLPDASLAESNDHDADAPRRRFTRTSLSPILVPAS